jgi:hypothetical protein
MKTCGVVDIWIQVFSTCGGELSASHSCRFALWEEAPRNHCMGGLVGPKAVIDDMA